MNRKIEIKEIFNIAYQNHTQKKFENAKNYYEQILKIDPEHFDTNCLLGTLYLQTKQFDKAKIKFQKAIQIQPNHSVLCNNFGATLIELKEYEKAINYFEKAIQIQPDYAEAYNNLGSILKETEQHEKAIKYFQKAIQFESKLTDAHFNLGVTFKELGNFESAINCFNKVIQIDSHNIKAHQNLMESYERINQPKKLNETILNAKKFLKDNPVIKLYEAIILYNNNKFSKSKDSLESISFQDTDIKSEIMRLLTLARCYDRIEDSENAYKYFTKVNNLSPKLYKINLFDKSKFLKSIEIRTKFFAQPKVKQWKTLKSSSTKPDPVFLIGFPRSGTTLLDTVLRSHSKIEVIEEKPMVHKLVASLNELPKGGLEDLENINSDQLEKIKKVYFDCLETQIKDIKSSKIYIDKLPLNIIYVGEILRIFPNSKFILSIRHPYDCVLSCFMQNFAINNAMANFLDLNDAAYLYDVVMNLWTQYISNFKINYHEVKYESLIENFEPTIKSVLNFLELPWSNSVLKYTTSAKKRKNIATPSYNQVTKPIYSHASGRWKKYEKQISNIYPILEPWLKKFDY